MKRTLSFLLSLVMVIGIITSVPVTVNAASLGDLTFKLNNNKKSYYVADCKESAKGKLTIPEKYNGKPVTSIGSNAFEWCENLASITIPDSVTNIGDFAFVSCANLISVTIGKGVTSIGDSAFRGSVALESITVNRNNNKYSSINGVLFNKNKTELIQYPFGKKISSYIIPDSVTKIGSFAFAQCHNLTSITIPNSIKTIGSMAFAHCGVESIKIPNSIKTIGDEAFAYCDAKSITLPDKLTSIGSNAFFSCYCLTSIRIPNSVTSIGEAAFAQCLELTSITIPDSVKNIGDWAFAYSGITSITLPDKLTRIGEGAFSSCTQFKSIRIPESVTSIGDYAFSNCGKLSSVKIGVGVKSIGESAFSNCLSLTSITIPGTVTSIGDRAFHDCKKLKSAKIPKSVKNIGAEAFGYCYNNDGEDAKVKSFTIYGASGSIAEKYAKNNGFTFKKVAKPGKTTLTEIANISAGVKISWKKVSGATEYEIYRKSGDGSYKKIATTTNISYIDKTAKSGTNYRYNVKAANAGGTSSLSDKGLTIKCLADPVLKVPTSTKSGITLKWNKVTGAQGYVVYRKTGNGNFTKLATVKGVSKVTYTDKKAKKGTKYTYKLKAYSGKTYSAYSNAKTIKDKY